VPGVRVDVRVWANEDPLFPTTLPSVAHTIEIIDLNLFFPIDSASILAIVCVIDA
jgi:hypothetical protein